MSGLDSAFGPTLEQAKQALADGYLWWGWYLPGGSQFHAWSHDEVAVLNDAGFELTLPIWVPRMDGGRIVPTANPETDALRAVWMAGFGYGWKGVVALDTEASMRGDPWTADYEARFGDAVLSIAGWQAVTYAGGFTFGAPPKHIPWWIWPGAPPNGQARQWGQVQFSGLDCDIDHIGSGFPLATKA